MRVAFLHNRSSEDPAQAAEDEVPARSPVVAALARLGHDVTPIACTLDLASLRRQLLGVRADVAFNRVESLGGSDSMSAAVALLLDSMQMPYTGCPAAALVATASKLEVKQQLVTAGLPTSPWVTSEFNSHAHDGSQDDGGPIFIIKAVYEHASFGLNDTSLVDQAGPHRVAELLHRCEVETGRPHFAEQFVAGREFNLSLIAPGPQVLPPAEIDFSSFPAGKPRIVGHDAKCNHNSFEYVHTKRRFDFPPRDKPLIDNLTTLATECWRLFGLRGYARVDFRCDATHQPWILDINPNPCILPDAGFAAALEAEGIAYDKGIQRILDDAIERRPMHCLAQHLASPLVD